MNKLKQQIRLLKSFLVVGMAILSSMSTWAWDDEYDCWNDHSHSIPTDEASVYDGYLHIKGDIMGTIQVKVNKSKITYTYVWCGDVKLEDGYRLTSNASVTIKIVGEKEISLNGNLQYADEGYYGDWWGAPETYPDGFVFYATDEKGRTLKLEFDYNGFKGSFCDNEVTYDISGARNFFSSRLKCVKSLNEKSLGVYKMICDNGVLSVTLANKGKATIKGTYQGVKVSAKAQAIIYEDGIYIPVIYSKESVSFGFIVWLTSDGEVDDVVGLDDLIAYGKSGNKSLGILKPYLGAYNMSLYEDGFLSMTIAENGKVTIKGKYQGAKVTTASEVVVCGDEVFIPVVYTKKSISLAFIVSLRGDDVDIYEIGEVDYGLDVADFGKVGTLRDGASFWIDGDIADYIETENEETFELLPDGETITASGSKWLVEDGIKPAKVAYKDGEFVLTSSMDCCMEAVNPSGLKLTYKAKDGTFNGSFTVYAIVKGKLKKHKATVEGVLINGVGYGMATIKKIGTWAVGIE